MSKPEQAAWDSIRPMLVGMGLDPKRVENVVGPGHPDVDYVHGNIELKHMDAFPARPGTLVKVPEFTGEQAGWLAQRWAAGGLAWLLIRVGREWYLFDGWTALQVYRGLDRVDWQELAALHYPAPSKGWRAYPDDQGSHPWSRQLQDWLKFDLDRLMPWSRARAMRLRCQQTPQSVASALGWELDQFIAVELGGPPELANDLLDYWNA